MRFAKGGARALSRTVVELKHPASDETPAAMSPAVSPPLPLRATQEAGLPRDHEKKVSQSPALRGPSAQHFSTSCTSGSHRSRPVASMITRARWARRTPGASWHGKELAEHPFVRHLLGCDATWTGAILRRPTPMASILRRSFCSENCWRLTGLPLGETAGKLQQPGQLTSVSARRSQLPAALFAGSGHPPTPSDPEPACIRSSDIGSLHCCFSTSKVQTLIPVLQELVRGYCIKWPVPLRPKTALLRRHQGGLQAQGVQSLVTVSNNTR